MDRVEESMAAVLTQCCAGGEDKEFDANKISESVQILEFEQFQNHLARLCGLATVLSKNRFKKRSAARKLESLLAQEKLKALERVDNLEALKKKLESRQKYLKELKSSLHENTLKLKDSKEKFAASGSSLLHAARNLGSTQSRLQEAERLLVGDAGYGRLTRLKILLTSRRRCMVAEVAALYPLIPCTNKKKCPSFAHAGEGSDCTPLTISGLHVIAPMKKEASLFTDKREYETSATALGYVAHLLTLLARFLDIRLRYPIRYRASRSYIQDFSPPIEPSTGGVLVLPAFVENGILEFPLFSHGQDPTRAAYAVFLLNKDLEQILHRFDVPSVGPRHILPNLKRILKTICREGQSLA